MCDKLCIRELCKNKLNFLSREFVFKDANFELFLRGLIFADRFRFSFQTFHVTSQDCIVKESCDSIGGFLLPYVTTLQSLVVQTL